MCAPARWFTARLFLCVAAALALALGASTAYAQCGVLSVSPSTGPTAGGTEIVFSMSNAFTVSSVEWDGHPAQILSSTLSTLRVRVPAGQGIPLIRFSFVTGSSCTAQGVFSYAAPIIHHVSPSTVNPGVEAVLSGVNFGLTPVVRVGGVVAELLPPSSHHQIRFRAPSGLMGEQPVVVQAAGATSQPVTLTYAPVPIIISTIAPVRRTSGGDMILVRGLNFGVDAQVLYGNSLAETYLATPTEIIAMLPASDAVPMTVRVVREGVAGPVGALLLPSSAKIHGFSPPSIPAGVASELTIYGENFGTLPPMVFVGVSVEEILSVTHGAIVVRTAALAPGEAQVQIVVGGGLSYATGTVGVHQVCQGDTNGDGLVNFTDLSAVLSAFGQACQGVLR